MGFNAVAIILISISVMGGLQLVASVQEEDFAKTFLRFPNHGKRPTRMSLGTQVGTGECAHIGRTCMMTRNSVDNPSVVNYVPCCQHLECQGFGGVERRNGMGQAHSTSDTEFSGICSPSLNNGGGDIQAYKAYVADL